MVRPGDAGIIAAMTESATYRGFKRRIGQLLRRLRSAPGLQPAAIGTEVVALLDELRHAAESEPEIVLEIGLSMLEILPQDFHLLDDKVGLLGRALDQVPQMIVDILHDERGDPRSVIDRGEILERLFCLWVGDETGYLRGLDESLAECVTDREDADRLIGICRDHLRHLPLVFPAAAGEKLDLDRVILQSDRHRVERLLGEIFSSRGRHEYAVIVARGHFRTTRDALDLVRALERAGQTDEAVEVARRALRRPDVPRHAELRAAYDELLEIRDGTRRSAAAREREFLDSPSLERFLALKEAAAGPDWPRIADKVLGLLQGERREPALVFQLYLGEGRITDADGLVVTQPIDALILAEAAHAFLESHPSLAGGWLLVAAHRILEGARREHYETAAEWLGTVRRLAEVCDQRESFDRALEGFRSAYRRRPALLRTLERYGL